SRWWAPCATHAPGWARTASTPARPRSSRSRPPVERRVDRAPVSPRRVRWRTRPRRRCTGPRPGVRRSRMTLRSRLRARRRTPPGRPRATRQEQGPKQQTPDREPGERQRARGEGSAGGSDADERCGPEDYRDECGGEGQRGSRGGHRARILRIFPEYCRSRINLRLTMCRNIKTLANFAPPATDDEIRASALQFVRKLSGAAKPSHANEAVFDRAVDEVSGGAHRR